MTQIHEGGKVVTKPAYDLVLLVKIHLFKLTSRKEGRTADERSFRLATLREPQRAIPVKKTAPRSRMKSTGCCLQVKVQERI